MKQAQLWGNTKEATTFTVAFSMDRCPLDMLIEQAAKTDAVLLEERTRHVTSDNNWAITATTILQFTATLDNVLNPSKEGEAWILLWDMASIHAIEGTMTAMKEKFPRVVLCFLPPQSTSQAWTTGWRPLRAHSDAPFKEAVAEAVALHSRDELFAKHIEPEPAPVDPVDWAMAEASDDDDDAPMPDAPPEPEMIDMPPASARPMSNLAWWRPGEAIDQKKKAIASYHVVLSVVSRVRCLCSVCPAQAPRQ